MVARQWAVPHLVEFDPQLREAFLTVEDYLAKLDEEIAADGGGGGPAPTDHGGLTGLGDDDHPQYVRNTEVIGTGSVTATPNADGTVTINGTGLSQAAADTRYVNTTGDTMTGDLTLVGVPVGPLAAVPKSYVDSRRIDDLTDVDTTTVVPSGGEFLQFDSSTGLWLPRRITPTTKIDDLTDVDTASQAPLNGQVLTWDDAIHQWRPANVSPVGTELGPEVFSTDGSNVGTMFYGPNNPGSVGDGAIFFTTRFSVDTVPPVQSPVTGTPTLTITTPTTTTVTASWTAVANAAGYELFADGTSIGQFSGLTTTYTQAENTTRQMTVRGFNTLGPGPLSAQKASTVPNLTPPPVTNLRAGGSSRGSLTFAWDYTPPADFSVYVVTTSAGTASINASAKTVTISGLGDSVTINVTVAARDTGGLTSTTAAISGTTPAAPPPTAPPAPTGLATTRVGYSSADFSWNASAGATGYQMSGDNGATWANIGNVLTFSWTGLAEYTNYVFYVRAVNAGGTSTAATLWFATLPKIHHYDPVYQDRTFGYGGDAWGITGIEYYDSGVYSTSDGWAAPGAGANDWNYTVDLNTNTGPYSTTAGRFITFKFSQNFDAVYQVYGYWGYPGTMTWKAQDTLLNYVAMGQTAQNTWPVWCTANLMQAPSGNRIQLIRMEFDAGLGSPGVFKLREWAINVRTITSYTPVYNPP